MAKSKENPEDVVEQPDGVKQRAARKQAKLEERGVTEKSEAQVAKEVQKKDAELKQKAKDLSSESQDIGKQIAELQEQKEALDIKNQDINAERQVLQNRYKEAALDPVEQKNAEFQARWADSQRAEDEKKEKRKEVMDKLTSVLEDLSPEQVEAIVKASKPKAAKGE